MYITGIHSIRQEASPQICPEKSHLSFWLPLRWLSHMPNLFKESSVWFYTLQIWSFQGTSKTPQPWLSLLEHTLLAVNLLILASIEIKISWFFQIFFFFYFLFFQILSTGSIWLNIPSSIYLSPFAFLNISSRKKQGIPSMLCLKIYSAQYASSLLEVQFPRDRRAQYS